MIFVMLGTQKQEFKRLLDILNNSLYLKDKEVVIQSGYTKYDNFKLINFLSEDEMNKYISDSDFIITHGGVGSIFRSLENKKKVITIPRQKIYKEHVDNHQNDICKKLDELGYIINYTGNIDNDIDKLINSNFKEYNLKNNYVNIIKNDIDSI